MITMEAWTTIRYLHAQGKGKKTIARELGVSRNTVRRALARPGPPRYQRPPRPNQQVAPFEEAIRSMRKQGLIGSRILREMKQRGYGGSRSALYSFLGRLKAEEPDPRTCLRYETEPGQQAQFDWSPYTVELGGVLTRVVVFSSVLGYSRRKHFSASLDARQDSIYGAVEEGFWHFGGSTRQILVDNDRSFVLDARPEHFRWNPHFLELCGHYSVQPIACRVRNPRGKGKVENPFRYLENQYIKGSCWRDFGHFCEGLARFEAEDVDLQVHGTTRERPVDRFQREIPYLVPLPEGRFVGSHEELRKVSWDCLVPFRGNKYGVPSLYAGKRVWVRTVQGHTIKIHNQKGDLIASHILVPGKGVITLLEGQYDGLRQAQPRTWVVLREAFLERFPKHETFLEKLHAQQRFNHVAHMRGILELARLYPSEVIEEAFKLAEAYNTFSKDFIRGLVEQRPPREAPLPSIPLSLRPVPVLTVQSDLRTYQELLTGRGWR
ncbi:MAG: IS21 family transposase [Chloroflexota bacterium]